MMAMMDQKAREKIEAALLPDKDKIIEWIHIPLEIPSPEVKDEFAMAFVAWFEAEIETLVEKAMKCLKRL